MQWLCDVYDKTASNYKKPNDVIERIQENERFIERLEKKQLIEIKKQRYIKRYHKVTERVKESNKKRVRVRVSVGEK